MTRPGSFVAGVLGFLALVFAAPTDTGAQSAFSLEPIPEITLGLASVASLGAGFLLPEEPGEQVPLEEINTCDRWAVRPLDPMIDRASTYAAYAALVMPALPVLYEIDFPTRFVTYGVMYTEAFLLAYGAKEIVKALVSRHRPYTYVGAVPEGEQDDYFNSFPSGHTSLAFMAAAFVSFTFAREYPDSPWKAPTVIGAYALAGGVGLSRILSGSHFPTDVIAGALLGTGIGLLVPALHLR